MILTPNGVAILPGTNRMTVNRSATPQGSACPRDPYHYQRGEAGYFHDSQLGEVPNDFELSTAYGYTPVNEGWTQTNQGLVPGGVGPGGQILSTLGQLRDAASDLVAAEEVFRKKSLALQAITGVAVVLSAGLAAYRTARLIHDEHVARRGGR